MFGMTILTTGVLAREPDTVSAVANIVNFDNSISRLVTVEVWDWSSYDSPVQVPVLIGENVPVAFPYLLEPNHLAVMYADLNAANVSLYEMRIIYTIGADIVTNCFGRSQPPYASQEGNTVYQKQLVSLKPSALSMAQLLAMQVRLGRITLEQVASHFGAASAFYKQLVALVRPS